MNKKPLCALVIGHAPESPGASNKETGLTEYDFNTALAQDIKHQVKNVDIVIVFRNKYRDLPEKINNLNPDFIISLHCNAFNRQTSGIEVLYYEKSVRGRRLASFLLTQLVRALPLPNRGIKPRGRRQRGGFLLKNTIAPCVIAEPFFIDNYSDMATARNRIDQLVTAYADAIEQYAETL